MARQTNCTPPFHSSSLPPMIAGYKGRKGGRGSSTLKGSFVNGSWHCDCNPPQIAVHLQVKKEGANKGRWFRVCQKAQTDKSRCKFFLWDSEAHPRENAALANNSRTEPARASTASTTTTPSRPPPPQRLPPPSTPTPQSGPPTSNQKRSLAKYQEQDEEDTYGLGDDDDFESRLDQVREEVETPLKKARTDAFTTPVTTRRKLPWVKESPKTANNGGLHTPQTGQRAPSNPFITTEKISHNLEPKQTLSPSSSPTETPTPTPTRAKDVHVDGDVARDVFAVLSGAKVALGEQARRDLTAILSKHATVAEGIKKGRDVARATVAAKEARVQELTFRVGTLEAELEAEKQKVEYLQFRARTGHDSD